MKSQAFAVWLALSCCAVLQAAEQHPADAKGFGTDRTLQVGNLDHVNLFTGNLSVTIPIGSEYRVSSGLRYGFVLSYNSRIWEHRSRLAGSTSYVRTDPTDQSNTGLGWMLTLGRLDVLCSDGVCGAGSTYSGGEYESPDGATHSFFPTLHDGEAPSGGFVAGYTRDGTFLRLRKHPVPNEWHVEFPDGAIHVFQQFQPSNKAVRLISIRDTYGNSVSISYPSDDLWEVTDTHGRTQRIYWRNFWSNVFENYSRGVDRVELTSFGSGTVTYKFVYDATAPTDDANGSFRTRRGPIRNPSSWDPIQPAFVVVPALTGIQVRAGSGEINSNPLLEEYSFSYYADSDATKPAGTADLRTGALRKMIVPAGGSIEWDYQNYSHPAPSCDDALMLTSVPGVKTRTVRDGVGPSAVWTYSPALLPQPGTFTYACGGTVQGNVEAPAEGFTNTVTSPAGHRQIQYFSVWNVNNTAPAGSGSSKRDFGLPFVKTSAYGGRYLSTKWQECSGSPVVCSDRKSLYVVWERDGVGEHWVANRRESSRRTVFHEDSCSLSACKYTDATRSDYDGLGHYRRVDMTANFGNGTDQLTRFTNWNPGGGTYAPVPVENSFVVPGAAVRWLVNTFDLESASTATDSAATSTVFANGLPVQNRTYKQKPLTPSSSPAAGTSDLVTALCRDAFGNVTREQYLGGDLAGTGTNPCATGPPYAAGEFEISSTYEYGELRTSSYTGLSNVFHADRIIDRSTGLPSSEKDSGGVSTTYNYDALRRPTAIFPTGRAPTVLLYNRAITEPFVPATVTVTNHPAGTTSGSVLSKRRLTHDGLGRVWREYVTQSDGSESMRETLYDGEGRVASVSLLGNLASRTLYKYDSFGRVVEVTAPDGAITKFLRSGVFKVERKESVATAPGTVMEASTIEEYDALGRLRSVTQRVGNTNYPTPVGGAVLTEYGYDIGGRLSKVTMNKGSAPEQVRVFTYDRRGFLESEDHPETDLITYSGYDARGHAQKRKVGGGTAHDLSFTYDSGERLEKVDILDAAAVSRPFKVFSYGPSNPQTAATGKLLSSVRYNYAPAAGYSHVRVTETFGYGDLAGRRTSRTTLIESATQPTGPWSEVRSITQSLSYNDLDEVSTLEYPMCVGCGAPSFNPTRGVSYSYSNGFLDRASGYFGPILYDSSGNDRAVPYLNGVRNEVDYDVMGRPQELRVETYHPCIAPSISTVSGGGTVASGAYSTLTATVTGRGYAIRWYRRDGANDIEIGTGSAVTVGPIMQTTTFMAVAQSRCGSDSKTVTLSVALPAPGALQATRTGALQIRVWWQPVSGASSYRVERAAGAGFATHATSDQLSFDDFQVAAGEAYAYRVRAVDSNGAVSAPSNVDVAVTLGFTPVGTSTLIADEHLHEILAAINALRRCAGYAPVGWTSPAPANGGLIYAQHFDLLRAQMDAARGLLTLPNAPHPDPNLRLTPIRALHITDLQARAQ